MRLQRARVRNYRSIKDSGWFDLEAKTILVGPNEGGKTALLRALEQLNAGRLALALDPLRDFPRSEYRRLSSGSMRPNEATVVEAEYLPDDEERASLGAIAPPFAHCRYYRAVRLDGSVSDRLLEAPDPPSSEAMEQALRRLAASVQSVAPGPTTTDIPGQSESQTERGEGPGAALNRDSADPEAQAAGSPSGQRTALQAEQADTGELSMTNARELASWLENVVAPNLDPSNAQQTSDLQTVRQSMGAVQMYLQALDELRRRVPLMIYTSSYPSVSSHLHLGHLADAIEAGAIDETDEANFGNFCLLNLLNFSARELSELGKAKEPEAEDVAGFERYRAQLDERDAALNVASRRLTELIKEVWTPSSAWTDRDHYIVRITADQQYLKVVVEDSLGVPVELDQRSEGFQWLVSFMIVYFSQHGAGDGSTVLLLDEPGLSLHGLKQREFRGVLSRLGQLSQLVFSTHSPFMVGPDEIDLVRLVELTDRAAGTKVSTVAQSTDPASLVPLQAAIGYELAGQLFSARKTLVVHSLTDYLYLQATTSMLVDSHMAALDTGVELVPMSSISTAASLAALLHGQGRRVVAVVDLRAEPETDAGAEALRETLGQDAVVPVDDGYEGPVAKPRMEDLLRQTLVRLGRDLGWDVGNELGQDRGERSIVDVFSEAVGPSFTRYRLATAYVRWTAIHKATDLAPDEQVLWMKFIERLNQALA